MISSSALAVPIEMDNHPDPDSASSAPLPLSIGMEYHSIDMECHLDFGSSNSAPHPTIEMDNHSDSDFASPVHLLPSSTPLPVSVELDNRSDFDTASSAPLPVSIELNNHSDLDTASSAPLPVSIEMDGHSDSDFASPVHLLQSSTPLPASTELDNNSDFDTASSAPLPVSIEMDGHSDICSASPGHMRPRSASLPASFRMENHSGSGFWSPGQSPPSSTPLSISTEIDNHSDAGCASPGHLPFSSTPELGTPSIDHSDSGPPSPMHLPSSSASEPDVSSIDHSGSGSLSPKHLPSSSAPLPVSIEMDSQSDSGSSSPGHSRSSSASELSTPSSEISTPFGESFEDLHVSSREFIAVVGGLGYIGSHTCLERSVYDRIEVLAKNYFETRCESIPQMKLYESDYRDEVAMREILEEYVRPHTPSQMQEGSARVGSRIRGVIHFGAYKSVSESIQRPLKYYGNNVAGLIEFCSILDSFQIKTFVFSSSATVYGSIANSGVPLMEEYCTHQAESFVDHDGATKTTTAGCTGLTNPYGRTKWMCEAILSDLALADPEWTILALRYFNPVGCDESGLLGEDPRGIPTNLMPVVVRVLTGVSAVLDVFGTDYPTADGTAIRDFIHVTDLARGHIAALAAASGGRVPTGFRTYNLGSGKGHSVLDVVGAVETASSSKIPLRTVDRREGDVGICVAMPKRAEAELNWKTEKSLDTCCRDI
jgi:UDP-glucose 4-epimerase